MGEIGWDVVAKRLAENMSHLQNIAKQSFKILGAEIGIIVQEIGAKLPIWLGGSDKKAAANIAAYEDEIKTRMAIIAFDVGVLINEATKPPENSTAAWGEWADDMDDMWASLGPEFNSGPVEIFSEEDLDFARDMTGQFETFGLTLAQAKINAD